MPMHNLLRQLSNQRPRPIRSGRAYCHFASVLPVYCQRTASVLPAYCQHTTMTRPHATAAMAVALQPAAHRLPIPSHRHIDQSPPSASKRAVAQPSGVGQLSASKRAVAQPSGVGQPSASKRAVAQPSGVGQLAIAPLEGKRCEMVLIEAPDPLRAVPAQARNRRRNASRPVGHMARCQLMPHGSLHAAARCQFMSHGSLHAAARCQPMPHGSAVLALARGSVGGEWRTRPTRTAGGGGHADGS